MSQSVTNRFDRSEENTNDSGDTVTSNREGSETLSITIENGTTVITSWSISGMQFSFEASDSTTTSNSPTFEEKQRYTDGPAYGYQEAILEDQATVTSDSSLAIELGTQLWSP